MSKRVTFIVGVVLMTLFMTGCCLKHDWEEATCKNPKTCSKCGKTEGSTLDHEWKAPTCTEPKTCELCGKKKGDALGHDFSKPTCILPMICSVCGATEGIATGHEWSTGTCVDEIYCYNCGETNGYGEHMWVDATCFMPKSCWLCDAHEGERLPHTWHGETNLYCEKCLEDMPENSCENGEVLWNGIGLSLPSDFKVSSSSDDSIGVFMGEGLMFTASSHWNSGASEYEVFHYYDSGIPENGYNVTGSMDYANSDGTEFRVYEVDYSSAQKGYCIVYYETNVFVYMECWATSWEAADKLMVDTLDSFYVYY